MKTLPFLRSVLVAVALLGGVAASAETKKEGARKAAAPAEMSPKDKRYYFQHRLLARLTHKTEGGFFADLQTGSAERLKAAATDMVGAEFAEGLAVRVVPGASAVLITFPKPVAPPECYHALVIKDGKKYRYVTLEQSEDLFATGVKSVVGEWAEDGSHLNLGGRTFVESEAFIADVLKKK